MDITSFYIHFCVWSTLLISLDWINYGVIFVPLHLFFQNPTVIIIVRVFEVSTSNSNG